MSVQQFAGEITGPGIYPDSAIVPNGVHIKGTALIKVIGSDLATIDAVLEEWTSAGWFPVPNPRAVFSGMDSYLLHGGGRFRLNVTAASNSPRLEIRQELGNR